METIEEGPVTLAEKWEANRHIRNRIRSKGMLVVWPKPELVGKPTMASISLNIHALRILAEDWCPKQSGPKSPSVHAVRKEVGSACGSMDWLRLFVYSCHHITSADLGPSWSIIFYHWLMLINVKNVLKV